MPWYEHENTDSESNDSQNKVSNKADRDEVSENDMPSQLKDVLEVHGESFLYAISSIIHVLPSIKEVYKNYQLEYFALPKSSHGYKSFAELSNQPTLAYCKSELMHTCKRFQMSDLSIEWIRLNLMRMRDYRQATFHHLNSEVERRFNIAVNITERHLMNNPFE